MIIYANSAVPGTDIEPYFKDTFQIVDEAIGGVIAFGRAWRSAFHVLTDSALLAALDAA